jgi:hypothetical protein
MTVQSRGSTAEQAASEKYGFQRVSESWYDGVNPQTGTKYEVKSGLNEIRFWEDQHRSLTASNNQNSARYVVVQTDRSGNIHRMMRKRPTTITRLVNEHGGWVESGHHRTNGREKYIPISDLF